MEKVPLIWNITRACPWNCFFCCVSAHFISLHSPLEDKLVELKKQRIEINLEDKLKILDNINANKIEIDISGGDPLIFKENILIIKELASKFGKENISITTTGRGLELVDLKYLKNIVGEVGFTYDFPYEPDKLRPLGYNSSNINSIKKVVKEGMRTMSQTPLTRINSDKKIIRKIYKDLSDAGVDRLLLMKFFAVGRGLKNQWLGLTNEEYQRVIENYKRFESPNGPKILINTSLRDPTKNSKYYNITSKGLLLSNPWAYDINGEPLEDFILGDLKNQKILDIIKNKRGH